LENLLGSIAEHRWFSPIFGAIAGALWGPVVFLWIVFGTIFAGAVHDFLAGMISIRHKGASISEIVGIYLGPQMKFVMRIFSVVLLVLVGTVFMTGPAGLLARLTPDFMTRNVWLIIVLVYYFLATILPIDQLIGRVYPLFGAALLIMAAGIAGGIIFTGVPMAELTFANLHPSNLPIWPLMFITVACGAISGFHANSITNDGTLLNFREERSYRILWRDGCGRGNRIDLGCCWCSILSVDRWSCCCFNRIWWSSRCCL
jgi:carbon starvation protein CstA